MISVEECRGLLGGAEGWPDDEVRALRDQLYALAVAVITVSTLHPVGAANDDRLTDDERADVEERAAILEHDGGLPRSAAERIARSAGRNRRQ
jgi:hypothetical protein